MHLESLFTTGRVAGALMLLASAFSATAAVNYYECADKGFFSAVYDTDLGVVATTNRGSEIFLLNDNKMVPLVKSPGAGMYINVSPDGKTVGFKSLNNDADQAPALLDIATGRVTLLEDYSNQCGQVSFAADGTIAYTVENKLIIRNGAGKRSYDLGFYTNIVNINPAGTEVAYCDMDGQTYILNLSTGLPLQLGTEGVYRPIWSPGGKKLALQTVFGGLKSYDKTSGRTVELGKATSVAWADNDNLLITRSDEVNEFQVSGASVMRISADGNGETTILSSEDTPIAVSASGNKVLVSYAGGAQRGIKSLAFRGPAGIGAPSRTVDVLSVARDARIGEYVPSDFGGHMRPQFNLMSDAQKEEQLRVEEARNEASPRKGNDIGLTAIPYINQVWDTPAVGGSVAYGYVCCAPSSSCMMLGYYRKLTPHGVTSRSSYAAVKTCLYSWYVAMQYTSVTGYNFSTSASGGGYWGTTYGVKGGYGYMWGNGSPASMMANFHTHNGASSSSFVSSWSTLVSECNNNRPYIICLANGTGGHVVCVFRANQIAYNDGSGTYGKTGSFICHDPYGDYNASSYPNWDGRYSSYDWPGCNNGRKNIGTFYWGCVTHSTGAVVAKPQISFSPSTVEFNCMVNEHPSVTVNVTGKDLSSDISVASITPGRFSTSVSSLGKTGGSFTVTFNNSDKAGTYQLGGTAVDYNFYVKLKSGSTEAMVPIKATVTAPPLSNINEKFNFSKTKGNAESADVDFSQIRNYCYNDGKLYCVYASKEIVVLNAQTGAKLGVLSNGDCVHGGSATLADVKAINGKIVASNIASASQNESLRLYCWDSDTSLPYLLFETTDFQGADRLGDCLEMTGTFATDCWFAFGRSTASDTRIVEYNRKDGNWLAKHTKVYTSDGKPYYCGDTMRAYPKGGGWWVDGKGGQAAWVTWDDSKQGAVVQCKCETGQNRGSSHHEFYWKGIKYAVNLYFDDANGSNGRMRVIIDNAGNFSSTTPIGYYPSAGLGGGGLNPNGTGDCFVNTDGENYFEAWVLSTGQGLAYFTSGNVPQKNPQPFDTPISDPTNRPSLSVDKTDISLTAELNETSEETFYVTGEKLRSIVNLTVSGAGADQFSVSPNNLEASGTINVVYHPNRSGNAEAVITIKSQDCADVQVNIKGHCSTYVPSYQIKGLQTAWVKSSASNNLPSWFNANGLKTRDLANVGNTAVVLNTLANKDPEIFTLDADGNRAATVATPTDVIAGGTFKIAAIEGMGDALVATNMATAAGNLRIYKWNSLDAQPEVWLETTNHGNVEVGRSFMVSGDLNNGKIAFACNANNVVTVVYFTVSNGTIDPTPKVITTNKAGGSNSNIEAHFVGDGFWLASKDHHPRHFDMSGNYKEDLAGVKDKVQGAAMRFFTAANRTYVAATTTQGGASVWSKGNMEVLDVTDGTQNGSHIGTYPGSGFGDANWGGSVGSNSINAYVSPNQGYVGVWALVPDQGIGKFYYYDENSGVDDITVDEAEAVEYYNLQGVRIDAENLTPGIYIRRQGIKITKVMVR